MKTLKKKAIKKKIEDLEKIGIEPVPETVPPPPVINIPQSFKTSSGIELKQFYIPDDLAGMNYLQALGDPGEYPFTRGLVPERNLRRPWAMQRAVSFGSAIQANENLRGLVKDGETRPVCYFDLPTLSGYDSDHPKSFGEVGRLGVAVSSLQDMEDLFQGVPLGQIAPVLAVSSPALVLYSMYAVAAENQGVSSKDLRGYVQNDVLKEFMLQDACIFPFETALKLFSELAKYSAAKTPKFIPVSVDSVSVRDAGANAVQEIAFALASAFHYLNETARLGYDIEELASKMFFTLSAQTELFEEVAKFRAARRIWARWMKDKLKMKSPKAWEFHFNARTSVSAFTKHQNEINILRAGLGVLAAGLGGAEGVHVSGLEDVVGAGRSAAMTAFRLQQVIAQESKTSKVIDPLGGSYLVESLTEKMEEDVEKCLLKIEEAGGMTDGVKSGCFKREIEASLSGKQGDLALKRQGQEAISQEEVPMPSGTGQAQSQKAESFWEKEQMERLKALKKSRSKSGVAASLKELKKTVNGKNSLVPRIMDCVREYVTLGEIVSTMRECLGEYKPPSVF